MYRVVSDFNGIDEGKTFKAGEVCDFPAERGAYLVAKGFLIPVDDKKKKAKSEDEQSSADL